MSEYDTATARHYAAWRPPLHQQILALGLQPGEHFVRALDVGCGAGHSTHALLPFCNEVVGIDPSPEMIAMATPGTGERFVAQTNYNGSINQGFRQASFDLFSFAGSLNYQDPESVLEEIFPLAANGATVLVYDFDVHLLPVFEALGRSIPQSNYDHQRNFSGLGISGLREVLGREETLHFSASPTETAHLLFAVREWRETALAGMEFAGVVEQLQSAFPVHNRQLLRAKAYLTRYAF